MIPSARTRRLIRTTLIAAATLLCGCATYHPLPLGKGEGTPSATQLSVPASAMPVPELATHRFDPTDGLDVTEAAMLAGKDALQFRLDHVTDPRFKAIIEKLRTESAWDSRPSPAPGARASGKGVVKGRGMSIMLRDNGYWACAAHVAVMPESGEVKVERMTMVADVGIVINPLQLRRQIQAGCLMGVSQALHEEVSFDQGAITAADWASYPILTMAEAPEIKVVLETNLAAGNYGQGSESANALAAPAIAAAVLDATGKPVRRLPLRPDYVKAALA